MVEKNQLISVVIPVKNEVGKIRACIEGILMQTVPVQEIVVVDSGSTDGTLDILRSYDIIKLIEIPGSEFNHGESRNVGIRATTGDFVLLTVGDARAVDKYWIENLLKGFDAAENVVGVCGSQVVPHETDKNPVEWFRPVSQPKIITYKYSPEEFERLTPMEKRNVCGWDDVTAMYRKEVLIEIPFRFTTYAEDALWAKEALANGYTIAYNPAARVYHYHLEDEEFTFKRNYTVMYHMYKFYGLQYKEPEYTLKSYLSMAMLLWKAKSVPLKDKIKWWNYNIGIWKQLKKSVRAINEAIAKGEDYLDKQHQEFCGKPPIPKKVT